MNLKQKISDLDEKIGIKFGILLLILGIATYFRFRYAFFEGVWVDEGRYSRFALDIAKHPLDYSTAEAWKGKITGVPPLFPYLLALTTYIIPDQNTAVRVVSPIMSVFTIGITYKLGEVFRNKDTGLIAAGLLAIIPTFWFMSQRILIGATLAAVYTATIFALYYGLEDREYSKYALYALGPLTALSLLTMQRAYTLGPVMLIYFLYRKKDELKEQLEDLRKDNLSIENIRPEFRYLGAGAGLGLITLLPWSLRNMTTCGFPLCGLLRALNFASRDSSTINQAVFSVQGNMYFVSNLHNIVAIPVAALVLLRVTYLLLKRSDDMDLLIKYFAAVIIFGGAALIFNKSLLALALLTTVAILPARNYEKLLWLWIGLGIGFVSIGAIKVPRYIINVFPALSLVAAIMIMDIKDWTTRIQGPKLGYLVLAVLLIASFAMTFPQGLRSSQMMNGNTGYSTLEPAGNWVDENTPEDARLIATSKTAMMFYAYPRVATFPDKNRSDFEEYIKENNVTHVEVDTYEKSQPNWVQYQIPPYRVPNKERQRLRAAQRQGRQAYAQVANQIASNFQRKPDYLVPVASFGRERAPLTRDNSVQPRVIIHRVNHSALP